MFFFGPGASYILSVFLSLAPYFLVTNATNKSITLQKIQINKKITNTTFTYLYFKKVVL